MPKNNLFFFYGSLRSGYWNNRIIGPKSKLIGPAETVNGFDLYVGQFGPVPCVVPNPKGNTLKGELWSLSEEDAERVRRLEAGYDEGLFRVELNIPPGGKIGQVCPAFIYHSKQVEGAPYIGQDPILIPSGDYSDVISPNRERKVKVEVA